MEKEKALCGICGEPMPKGEEMFNYHGYSGNCPKPPLKKKEECICSMASCGCKIHAHDGVAPINN